MKSGSADVIMNGHTVDKALVGTILGEESLLDSALRAATVIATTECKLVPINRKRLDSLIAKTPGFLKYLNKVAAGRFNSIVSNPRGPAIGS
jgi:CRP-like cAMP-binding protein